MVFLAQKKKRFWQKYQLINGDMSALPFPQGTFDLIFANQTVHWSDSFAHLAKNI